MYLAPVPREFSRFRKGSAPMTQQDADGASPSNTPSCCVFSPQTHFLGSATARSSHVWEPQGDTSRSIPMRRGESTQPQNGLPAARLRSRMVNLGRIQHDLRCCTQNPGADEAKGVLLGTGYLPRLFPLLDRFLDQFRMPPGCSGSPATPQNSAPAAYSL